MLTCGATGDRRGGEDSDDALQVAASKLPGLRELRIDNLWLAKTGPPLEQLTRLDLASCRVSSHVAAALPALTPRLEALRCFGCGLDPLLSALGPQLTRLELRVDWRSFQVPEHGGGDGGAKARAARLAEALRGCPLLARLDLSTNCTCHAASSWKACAPRWPAGRWTSSTSQRRWPPRIPTWPPPRHAQRLNCPRRPVVARY